MKPRRLPILLLACITSCATPGRSDTQTAPIRPEAHCSIVPASGDIPGICTHVAPDGFGFVWAPYDDAAGAPPEFVAVVRLPDEIHAQGGGGTTLHPTAWFGSPEPQIRFAYTMDPVDPADAPNLRSLEVDEHRFDAAAGRILLVDARATPPRIRQLRDDERWDALRHGDLFEVGRQVFREELPSSR